MDNEEKLDEVYLIAMPDQLKSMLYDTKIDIFKTPEYCTTNSGVHIIEAIVDLGKYMLNNIYNDKEATKYDHMIFDIISKIHDHGLFIHNVDVMFELYNIRDISVVLASRLIELNLSDEDLVVIEVKNGIIKFMRERK